MPQNRKSKGTPEHSECPKSRSAVGRCSAPRPEQIRLKHPEGLIKLTGGQLSGLSAVDKVHRCKHCGVVYIDYGVPGMERILGFWGPQGFVMNSPS